MSSESARGRAFAWVAEVRARRRALTAAIADGSSSLAEALGRADGDEIVAGTKVLPLLDAVPGRGKVEARRFLAELGVDESATVGELDGDQRRRLGDWPSDAGR